MTNFTKQAQIHANLQKLACASRYIRRRRAQQKRAAYKQALSTAQKEDLTAAGLGAGAGGLVGGLLGYGFGGKNRMLSTILGAGAGAGIGGGIGYGVNRYYINPALKLEDKELANDLRNLRGQKLEEVGAFGDRLNSAGLKGDDLYAVNKAYNKALGSAVAKERKADKSFVLDKALYRPEMENDRTSEAYGVGSKQQPTGNKQWFDSKSKTRSDWETFTPDRVESELAAMQRAEDAGNLPKGSTQEAAQKYYDAMAHVDSAYQVMGGSEGIRLVGVDPEGRPIYNTPRKNVGWWGSWGSPSVNVVYDPKTKKYYKDRAGSIEIVPYATATGGGIVGSVFTVPEGGVGGLLGAGTGYGLGSWLTGDGSVKDFRQKLSNPDLAPKGGVSYRPILDRIKKTYRLQ